MKRLSISITNNNGIASLNPGKLAILTTNLTRLAGFVSKAVHFNDERYLHWIATIDSKVQMFEVVILIRKKDDRKILKKLPGVQVSDFGCFRKNPTCGYTTDQALAKILAQELQLQVQD